MTKLPQVTGARMVRFLERQGFSLVRVRGSHHFLERGDTRTSVPVDGSRNLKIGTTRSILRDIDMTSTEFIDLWTSPIGVRDSSRAHEENPRKNVYNSPSIPCFDFLGRTKENLVRNPRWFIALAAVCAVAACSWIFSNTSAGRAEAKASSAAPDTKPVEDDMHEFMEYVFQPTYLRLKASMADEPKDNNAWTAIKSDSLILAEGGNLLLIRLPDDKAQAATWREHAVSVRDFGGQLYRTAKKRDYEASQTHYLAMINRCNSCHDSFADGEHQLVP